MYGTTKGDSLYPPWQGGRRLSIKCAGGLKSWIPIGDDTWVVVHIHIRAVTANIRAMTGNIRAMTGNIRAKKGKLRARC